MASAGDNFKDIITAANHRAATDADTADSNLASAIVEGTVAIVMAAVVEEPAAIMKDALVEGPVAIVMAAVVEEPAAIMKASVVEAVVMAIFVEEPAPIVKSAVVEEPAAITSNEIHFWKVTYFALNRLVTIKSVLNPLVFIAIPGTQTYSIEFFIHHSSFRNLHK